MSRIVLSSSFVFNISFPLLSVILKIEFKLFFSDSIIVLSIWILEELKTPSEIVDHHSSPSSKVEKSADSRAI